MNEMNKLLMRVRTGTVKYPRQRKVVEIQDVNFDYIPGQVYKRKSGRPAIGIAEGIMFTLGIWDAEWMSKIAPRAKLDLFGPQSAYGLRLGTQLKKVVDDLGYDRDSRRAVITIASPTDTPTTTPCTMYMKFYIHGDELRSTAHMRSTDIMWGLPYDIIQFGLMTIAVARMLRLEPGPSKVVSDNMHFYDDVNYESTSFDDPVMLTVPKGDDVLKVFDGIKNTCNTSAELLNILGL